MRHVQLLIGCKVLRFRHSSQVQKAVVLHTMHPQCAVPAAQPCAKIIPIVKEAFFSLAEKLLADDFQMLREAFQEREEGIGDGCAGVEAVGLGKRGPVAHPVHPKMGKLVCKDLLDL